MFKYLSTIIITNLVLLGTITDVYGANIWSIPIRNETGGGVNDAHLRFIEKAKNVSIKYGNVVLACTPKDPDPDGKGFIFNCPKLAGFTVPNNSNATLLYESDCPTCVLVTKSRNPFQENVSFWTVDGEKAGDVTPLSATPTLAKNSPLALYLFNEEAFSVTYDNIQVFEGNNLSNFNLNNFAIPTGSLVTNLPTSITLLPGTSTRIDLSSIVEDPSTYVLATASFFPTTNPSEITSFSTAYDFGQQECIPEPSSILGVLSLGILGTGATLKRKLKGTNSLKKDPTKVG